MAESQLKIGYVPKKKQQKNARVGLAQAQMDSGPQKMQSLSSFLRQTLAMWWT